MNEDMTVACGNGMINLRAGAIILKDGKFLMTGNSTRSEYLYSVGGRIRFGETAEDAVIREVYEETGERLEIDRLGFIHENYFICDVGRHTGELVYELALYFYMKVPEDFSPVCKSMTTDGRKEFVRWVSPDEDIKLYPEFFRTELVSPSYGVRHFVTDVRRCTQFSEI